VYEYAGHRLWLAYGLAIAISALIVIAGLVVMYLSSAAYSSSFSTILRLGRGAHLSQEIVDGDHDGKDPLPEYLEKTTISFAGTGLWKKDADGNADYELVSVQAHEPSTTQESHEGRANLRRPSTLRPSEMSSEEPIRGPYGNGYDARSPSPNIEDADNAFPSRLGQDRVLQVPQSNSRI
jgi:hypothetical protein